MEVSPGFKLPDKTEKAPPANPMALTLQPLIIKALVVDSIFIQHKKYKAQSENICSEKYTQMLPGLIEQISLHFKTLPYYHN